MKLRRQTLGNPPPGLHPPELQPAVLRCCLLCAAAQTNFDTLPLARLLTQLPLTTHEAANHAMSRRQLGIVHNYRGALCHIRVAAQNGLANTLLDASGVAAARLFDCRVEKNCSAWEGMAGAGETHQHSQEEGGGGHSSAACGRGRAARRKPRRCAGAGLSTAEIISRELVHSASRWRDWQCCRRPPLKGGAAPRRVAASARCSRQVGRLQ